MDRKSNGVRSRLSNAELEELYCRRLQAVQNLNRNDPTRFRVVQNHPVGLPDDSRLPLNPFNIDGSWTSTINHIPWQNPAVDLSSTLQRAMGNIGLITPPIDVGSTHRSFYQGTIGTMNAPTTLPNQQSRIAASYPTYPLTRARQDNMRPLFDYSPDEVNWSTYVPLIPNKPNVIGPIIPPSYWTTPVYNPITTDEETGGLYHGMEGVYRHCPNSGNYRNNNGDGDNGSKNKIM